MNSSRVDQETKVLGLSAGPLFVACTDILTVEKAVHKYRQQTHTFEPWRGGGYTKHGVTHVIEA